MNRNLQVYLFYTERCRYRHGKYMFSVFLYYFSSPTFFFYVIIFSSSLILILCSSLFAPSSLFIYFLFLLLHIHPTLFLLLHFLPFPDQHSCSLRFSKGCYNACCQNLCETVSQLPCSCLRIKTLRLHYLEVIFIIRCSGRWWWQVKWGLIFKNTCLFLVRIVLSVRNHAWYGPVVLATTVVFRSRLCPAV
jgi:hypothetical protein